MEKPENTTRFLFWNIKDWGISDATLPGSLPEYDAQRSFCVQALMQDLDVDIATFAEVCKPEVIQARMAKMLPEYHTHVTGGKATRRLLTVSRVPVSISEPRIKASGWENPRHSPQILITGQKHSIAIVPIHAKSGSTQLERIIRCNHFEALKHRASELSSEDTAMIAIGDFNTVGEMHEMTWQEEVQRLERMKAQGLHLIPKNQGVTWKGIGEDIKYGETNIDHALVTPAALSFMRDFNNAGAKVHVGGWTDFASEAEQAKWVEENSDHAYLVVDICGLD